MSKFMKLYEATKQEYTDGSIIIFGDEADKKEVTPKAPEVSSKVKQVKQLIDLVTDDVMGMESGDPRNEVTIEGAANYNDDATEMTLDVHNYDASYYKDSMLDSDLELFADELSNAGINVTDQKTVFNDDKTQATFVFTIDPESSIEAELTNSIIEYSEDDYQPMAD